MCRVSVIAPGRSSRPAPSTYGAGVAIFASAVVINAFLIRCQSQSGCSWRSSAAAPVTCGVACEVPDICV